MTEEKPITLEQAVRQVVAELDGPTPVIEVIQRVLAIHPSAAKQPDKMVRAHISQHWHKEWVYLDSKTVIPLRLVMNGARFRIVLSRLEIRRGFLFFMPNFLGLVKDRLAPKDLTLLDVLGQPLPLHPAKIKVEHKSLLGDYTSEEDGWGAETWFRGLKARDGDSLLVTIEDWDAARYRLEHEPAGRRRFDEVDRKNRELADLLFTSLERARSEHIYSTEAIRGAYARMADPRGYPGDPWVVVVERDGRMKLFMHEIRYADSYSPIERILDRAGPRPKTRPVSGTQGQQVYRFKAAFRHRPGIWRRIEIQGKQTLGQFDDVLRNAFNHDFSDHLSGFWRKVRRGDTKRLREVDLGTIAPFGGESEGADTKIADIGLAVGDELKYVYDFGDWIEHTIKLEAIAEPEAGVEYPRVAERNKPQYQNCVSCAEQGRQTRAVWICHHCSADQDRAVVLCKDCMMAEHEEHYVDEIVY